MALCSGRHPKVLDTVVTALPHQILHCSPVLCASCSNMLCQMSQPVLLANHCLQPA
jgi:hypothetical protein